MTIQWYEILMLVGLPSILTFIFQLVITSMLNKKKAESKKEKAIIPALQVLLKDLLREHYLEHVKRKYIALPDREIYINLYETYHSLGSNGVMDDMYKQVLALSTVPPKPKPKKTIVNKENANA